MQNILLFIDLDDTIFQTKRKNHNGVIPATQVVSTGNISYMTTAQQLFFELFSASELVKIIPTTARNHRQYGNTFLSTHPRIDTAILYFGGMIIEDGKIETSWQARIEQAYSQMATPIQQLLSQVDSCVADRQNFSVYNVDDYYITVKAKAECSLKRRETLFSQLKTLKTSEYFIHQNDRALSLVPNFINKDVAVRYLIKKYNPSLTLGAGDSLTDLDFMHLCDFRIFPKNAQIEELMKRHSA